LLRGVYEVVRPSTGATAHRFLLLEICMIRLFLWRLTALPRLLGILCLITLASTRGVRADTGQAEEVQAGASAVEASQAGATPAALSPARAQTPTGPASRLDAVIANGVLRACTTGDYAPYSLARADGAYEGIDIELMQSLAKSLGVKVQFVKTSWPTLLADFGSRCDIAVGGVSTSLERQKHAAFSQPYLVDGKTPITRCDAVSRYQTLEDIDRPSVRVIVNPGGTNEKFARQYLSHAALTVFPDNVTIFSQIAHGKADVMVTDASETLLQHKLNPALCPVNPDKPLQYGEKAFMLPRGDVVFQQYVDQWLHLARSSGEFQKIVDSWLK
jgi:cyclohexadienyl dehydratase